MKSLVFTLLAFLVTWQTAQAEVSMPKFFSDNMVLQRERPIRIWGRAANGESVTVRFAGSEVSVQADRRFVWAKAYIRDDKTVVVFSDEVAEPVAVRYGWADNPQDDDLTDASGLLASPFRTDDWPGITK